MNKLRKNLMKQCDDLWSQVVKLKYYGCTALNQHPIVSMLPGLHPHHLITRSNKSVRWDTENGIPVTAQQHRAIHDGKIHIPIPETLQQKAMQVADTSLAHLKEIKASLKQELKERRKAYEDYWNNH